MIDQSHPFVRQYAATLLWSEGDNDGEPLDRNYSSDDFSSELWLAIRKDCDEFLDRLKSYNLYADYERIAHDFVLTRNGHGAGFWDGDWEEDEELILVAVCSRFKEMSVYVGDDGKLYAFGRETETV